MATAGVKISSLRELNTAEDADYIVINDVSASTTKKISRGNFLKDITGGGGSSYADANVDTHLNTGAAGSNQILSWDGSDYVWVNDQTGSGGTLASRTTPNITTTNMGNNVQGNFDVTNGFPTYALLKIQVSHAAWIRLYVDDASRTSDESRVITDDPSPDAGVVAEVITTGSQTIKMSPGVIGWIESGTNVPIRVQNLSGGSASITVTLTLVELEA